MLSVDGLVVERAAERVEGAQVARVLRRHVLVHFLGYGEHHAGALRLRLLEQARVYALCHSDPELEAFGHDAAGHGDEVDVLCGQAGEAAGVGAHGADGVAAVVEKGVLVLDAEARTTYLFKVLQAVLPKMLCGK